LAKFATKPGNWGFPTLVEGIGPNAFTKCPLTRIKLPANVENNALESSLIDGEILFETNLVNFYKSQGKKAGTYVKNGPVWSLQ